QSVTSGSPAPSWSMTNRLAPSIKSWIGCAVKGAGPQRGYTRPGTGSLHPVAIRAAVEVTRLLKPLVRRSFFATWFWGRLKFDEIGRSGRAWIRQGRVGSRLG